MERKEIAVALSIELVTDAKKVKPDLLCSICQQLLVLPVQCSKCKHQFHNQCL